MDDIKARIAALEANIEMLDARANVLEIAFAHALAHLSDDLAVTVESELREAGEQRLLDASAKAYRWQGERSLALADLLASHISEARREQAGHDAPPPAPDTRG